MKKYKINEQCETRYFVEFTEKNKNGERLVIEIMRCEYDNKHKYSLPNQWVKCGYTKHLYNTSLYVDTYCYLKDGTCVRKYNPTVTKSDNKQILLIDFDNLLEVSEENEKILIDKVYDLFMKGISD